MLHVSIAVALLSSIVWLAINLYKQFPAVGSKLLFIQTLLVFFWFLNGCLDFVLGSLIVLHDITAMQKVMQKLEYMTSFDQLTGL